MLTTITNEIAVAENFIIIHHFAITAVIHHPILPDGDAISDSEGDD